MATIDAARFTALKARVQAECLRRCYVGSVTGYGGSDYSYAVQPSKGKRISEEHYEKLAAPLAAINSDRVPGTDGARIVSEKEIAGFEATLTLFEARPMTDKTQGDCKTSCTGACHTECTGDCTGSCGENCNGTCTRECNGNCTGGCNTGCKNICTGCGGVCDFTCKSTCKDNCKTSCIVECGDAGCVGKCISSCFNGCDTGCGEKCGGCGNTCTAVSK